jgi:hypothetical protein
MLTMLEAIPGGWMFMHNKGCHRPFLFLLFALRFGFTLAIPKIKCFVLSILIFFLLIYVLLLMLFEDVFFLILFFNNIFHLFIFI